MKTINYLLIAAVLPAVSVGIQAGPQDRSLTVTKSASPAQQSAASSFWTAERIAAAKPFPMPVDYGSNDVDIEAIQADAEALGQPGMTPPGRGQTNPGGAAEMSFTDELQSLTDEADDGDTSNLEGTMQDAGMDVTFQAGALGTPADLEAGTTQVYTSYLVNNKAALWKVYPHKWVGRLSFSTPNGTSYCSATVISNNNIVTAAHCVYDTTNNRFYSNWVFSPAYRNGTSPYGTFGWTACTVLPAWTALSGSYSINTWARHDVAVCSMGNNALGQTLNQVVGWAGRSWNQPYAQLHFNSGYPWNDYRNIALANAGQYLRNCTAESFTQTTETAPSRVG
ncbi:MAG: trypsin-like serine protease [Chromatiaceae bacterium]|nr:trypsin-like serine protease [Chromatiaceae bacterium]